MTGCGVYSYTTSKAVLYNGASQSEAMAWLVVGKQQWGASDVDGQTLTISFPLAFSKLLAIAVSNGRQSGQLNPDNNPYDMTNTNFVVFTKGAFRYICVGIQQWNLVQWGKGQSSNYTNLAIPLPISFKSVDSYISVISNEDTSDGTYIVTSAISNYSASSVRCMTGLNKGIYNDVVVSFVCIGTQQWGFKTAAGSSWSVELPISYSSSNYCIATGAAYTENLAAEHVIQYGTVTATKFTIFSSTKTTFTTYWISIGKQCNGDTVLQIQ